jgi:hypothetical protein
MKAYIDERSMGAGKTYDAIERLITCKCKALFITERIESFDEVESTISKASIRHGVKPIVRRIHAGDLQWSNSVSREIGANGHPFPVKKRLSQYRPRYLR